MLKRLARKPSTASLTPATTKIAHAISIWFEAIAQTMIGTSRMRPSVMIFGILNAALPGQRPDFDVASSSLQGEPVPVYIVHAPPPCEPLHGSGIRRNQPPSAGTGHDRRQKRAHLRGFGRRHRCRESPG